MMDNFNIECPSQKDHFVMDIFNGECPSTNKIAGSRDAIASKKVIYITVITIVSTKGWQSQTISNG